jgi:hypothetical protein
MVERARIGVGGLHRGSWLRHSMRGGGLPVGDNALSVDVKLFDDLDEVERDARGALDRNAQPSLFARLSWFRLVAEHCPPPGRLLVARAQTKEDAWGQTKLWLFLSVDKGEAQILANWYSLRADLVQFQPAPGETAKCLAALARALRGDGIATLLIPRIADEPVALEEAFSAAGWKTAREADVVSWQIDTRATSFDDYWASRPSRLRNTAERKAKSAGLDIRIHTQFDEAAWTDYEAIYQASWKPEEGSPAILRALAEEEGQAGTLRLGIAYKDDQPIAAQLWLVEDKIATIHKLAYREDAKALSPGTVLSMRMFQHALDEDRVERIDYGTGDDAYKRDWMDERHRLWRFEAYNPSTFGGMKAAARAKASALVRRWRSR